MSTLKPSALVVLFVLAASTDWAIEPIHLCAKDALSCEMALERINEGRLWPDLRGRPLECRPAPGCFSPDSEVIKGFNAK